MISQREGEEASALVCRMGSAKGSSSSSSLIAGSTAGRCRFGEDGEEALESANSEKVRLDDEDTIMACVEVGEECVWE